MQIFWLIESIDVVLKYTLNILLWYSHNWLQKYALMLIFNFLLLEGIPDPLNMWIYETSMSSCMITKEWIFSILAAAAEPSWEVVLHATTDNKRKRQTE